MKTFAIFLAICVGLSCGQIRFSGSIGGSISNAIGLDIGNFAGVRGLFNTAGSAAAKESILGAAATAFLAKFKNGAFLAGKSASDIVTAFKDNAKKILSGPIPDWEITLDSELLGLTEAEFKSLLGTRPSNQTQEQGSGNIGSSRSKRQTSALPKTVDWRTKGAVSPVKNQKKCGSCWAFAAIGAIESRIGVKTGKTPILSEQNLVDCATNVGDTKCCSGCGGGQITVGYQYVQINKGVNPDKSYPYEAKDGQCRYKTDSGDKKSVDYEMVDEDDEKDLMRAVAEGPVAVALDANGWSSYKSGVYRCRGLVTGAISPLQINHGVLVVGYGNSILDGDYWLVKNSWGDSWGEKIYQNCPERRQPMWNCKPGKLPTCLN